MARTEGFSKNKKKNPRASYNPADERDGIFWLPNKQGGRSVILAGWRFESLSHRHGKMKSAAPQSVHLPTDTHELEWRRAQEARQYGERRECVMAALMEIN